MRTGLALAAGLAVATLPTAGLAELKASGEILLGFSNASTEDTEVFMHTDLNISGSMGGDGDAKFGFSLDLDMDANGGGAAVDAITLDDATVYFDFGQAGKLSYTTEGRCFAGAVPWIDGDLVSHNTLAIGGGDSVHTRVGGKARCVGYNPVVVDGGPPFGAKTDGYFKYENKIGGFKGALYFDPTQRADGYDDEDTITGIAAWEIEAEYKFGPVIGRVQYNELQDITLWAIMPMPKQGLFTFIRYEQQNDPVDPANTYRWTLFSRWNAKDMGIFKGTTLIYQADEGSSSPGYVAQLNFGDEMWNASVAMDEDGNFALEGAYSLDEKRSIKFGYDGGCDAGECFNANAGFGGAAAQDASWELAYSMKF